MEIKKTLLTGISASALVVASAGAASAFGLNVGNDAVDDVIGNGTGNAQGVAIGNDNGDDGIDDNNAVAVAALQQSAVQIVSSNGEDAIDDYEADMDFGDSTFKHQILNNNNFNTGANAVQGNALAVAGAADNSFGGGCGNPC